MNKLYLPTLEDMQNNKDSFGLAVYNIIFEDDSYISLSIDFSEDVDIDNPTVECVYLGETFYSSMNLNDYSIALDKTIEKVNSIKQKILSTKWY